MAAPPKAAGFKLALSSAKPGSKTKFSLGNKSSSSTAAKGEPQAKRPRLVLDDDDDDEDTNQVVAISGFNLEKGGAIDIDDGKKKEPKGNEGRVIPALPNRNWREEARRKRGETGPPGTTQNGATGDNTEQYQESKIQYGLTVVNKTDVKAPENDEPAEAAPEAEKEEEKDDGLTEDQRLENRALKSLLSGEPSADELRLIPAAATEVESFNKDYATAPEAPSLDAYLATPIDGFGAALLRGMGWKDGDELGKGPKEIKRRPELLGIGAKEAEWKGGANRRREAYNPITLKSKKTGELVSEAELKDKIQKEELLGKDKRKDKDRERYEFSDDEKSGRSGRRDKEKDSRRYRDRERSKERDRDRYEKPKYRSRSRDRDDRRDRDRDDRRDRDSRRDKDDRKDKDKDRDRRYRSRSRDSDRKKRRRDYDDEREPRKRHDRDRERDRDSGRDSGRDRDRGKDRERERDRHYRR